MAGRYFLDFKSANKKNIAARTGNSRNQAKIAKIGVI